MGRWRETRLLLTRGEAGEVLWRWQRAETCDGRVWCGSDSCHFQRLARLERCAVLGRSARSGRRMMQQAGYAFRKTSYISSRAIRDDDISSFFATLAACHLSSLQSLRQDYRRRPLSCPATPATIQAQERIPSELPPKRWELETQSNESTRHTNDQWLRLLLFDFHQHIAIRLAWIRTRLLPLRQTAQVPATSSVQRSGNALSPFSSHPSNTPSHFGSAVTPVEE